MRRICAPGDAAGIPGCGVTAVRRGKGERAGEGRIPGAGERAGIGGCIPGAGERAGERPGVDIGRTPGAGDLDGCIGGRMPGAGERAGGMGLRRPAKGTCPVPGLGRTPGIPGAGLRIG